MPELLKKSIQNFSAASLLIENELYASSVHCSYYSCLQKLKNVISRAYNIEYDELENERRRLNRKNISRNLATHEFLIDRKLLDLIRRERKDHRLINEINDIKLYRTTSDYDNVAISCTEAEAVLFKTQKAIEKLNTLI
jgi:uncharacterized protein (UPF0332 family)